MTFEEEQKAHGSYFLCVCGKILQTQESLWEHREHDTLWVRKQRVREVLEDDALIILGIMSADQHRAFMRYCKEINIL